VPRLPFDRIPDSARLWIFGAAGPVGEAAADRIGRAVSDFIDGWTAHGAPVVGGADWRHDRFLLVAADEEATGVSGCSIDALFRTLSRLEKEIGVPLLDSSPVWFRQEDGSIECLDRAAFRARVELGEIGEDTPVFDNTVGSVGEVRAGRWERPFAEAWHAKAFRRSSR
jgi:hypothetical protein